MHKPTLFVFLQITLGITIMLFSLYIFLTLTDSVLRREFIFFDDSISAFFYSLRTPPLTVVMLAITFLGSQYFLGSAIIVTIVSLFKKHKKDALNFAFILLFGIILNLILKDMFQRPRPDVAPLVYESTYSFPSGHAMNSFVFYTTLVYFIFRKYRNKKIFLNFTIICGLLILAIGVSRIYLGVHYPSDVIAGFAAGLLWFTCVLIFEKAFRLLPLPTSKKTK